MQSSIFTVHEGHGIDSPLRNHVEIGSRQVLLCLMWQIAWTGSLLAHAALNGLQYRNEPCTTSEFSVYSRERMGF